VISLRVRRKKRNFKNYHTAGEPGYQKFFVLDSGSVPPAKFPAASPVPASFYWLKKAVPAILRDLIKIESRSPISFRSV
jgi:hypothetical protein